MRVERMCSSGRNYIPVKIDQTHSSHRHRFYSCGLVVLRATSHHPPTLKSHSSKSGDSEVPFVDFGHDMLLTGMLLILVTRAVADYRLSLGKSCICATASHREWIILQAEDWNRVASFPYLALS